MTFTNVTNITRKEFNIRIAVAKYLDINWMEIKKLEVRTDEDDIYAEWTDEDGLKRGLFPVRIIQDMPDEDNNYRVSISNQRVKSYRVSVKKISKRMTVVHLRDMRTNDLIYTIQYINGRVVSTYSVNHGKTYTTRFLNVSFQKFPSSYLPLRSTSALSIKGLK